MNRLTALLLLAAGLSACSESKAPPSPQPSASPDGLRPITSRDRGSDVVVESKSGEASPAIGTEGLPPGHPPLGSVPPAEALPKHGMPGDQTRVFAGGPVGGSVKVAPDLTSRVAPTDVLYVIARDTPTRTVVAAKRFDHPAFPVVFEIGAADAMGSGVIEGPLEITARLSKSGDAIASPGDLEGHKVGVAFGARGVSITIETVRR